VQLEGMTRRFRRCVADPAGLCVEPATRLARVALGLLLAGVLLFAWPQSAVGHPGYSGSETMPVFSPVGGSITVGEVRASDRFVVHSASARTAERALTLAEQSWDALAGRFELVPVEPVTIVVVENAAEYERIQPAEMTRGFATFGGNSIYLKGSDLDQEVVTHEMAHILLGKNVRRGLAIPDWFNEGFAQFVSHADGRSDEVFFLVASGRLLTLPELDRVDALRGPDRELATVFGLAIVRFLVEEYGQDALWRLVDRLSRTPSFNQALFDTYGRTDLELSEEWQTYAEHEYGIFSLVGLQTAGFALVGLLSLAAVAAWLATRIRLRRRPPSPLDLTPWEIRQAERAAALLASRPEDDETPTRLEIEGAGGPTGGASPPTSPPTGSIDDVRDV
jgi:hypothetical protein